MRFAGIIVFLWFTSHAVADDVFAEAAAGAPYGVATVEIPLAIPIVGNPLPPLQVSDVANRVLYPVSHDVRMAAARPSSQPVPPPGNGRLLGRLGNLIREIASDDEKLEQTTVRRVTFLFQGDQPLRIRISDSRRSFGEYEIVPVDNPSSHAAQIEQWWIGYTAAANQQIQSAGYPPWVETYLVTMLARKLSLPLPAWFSPAPVPTDQLVDTFKLIAGAEDIRQPLFRQAAATGESRTEVAALPVPPPPAWIPSPSAMLRDDAALAEIAVEPLATRVPPECFYIRYGSFANYMWFRDLTDEYGGDISRMATLRGTKDESSLRLERQLNLQSNELSRLLGPTIIEDQAIIGRDMFLGDGASMGILFKATQPFLLRTSLQNDRATKARLDESVTLSDVTIANRSVSFLRSADNQIRSFLIEDGPFFFVTNSRTLAERFIEVGESGSSLASTTHFRLARRLMPLQREDTVFAYFSPEMLQGLVHPNYLIELRRRMLAKADITLVHLARLAARAEGNEINESTELAQAGFLPRDFGQRSDGTGTITVGQRVLDSSRGALGTFVPIADTKLTAVTSEESRWYEEVAGAYSDRFNQLDPIMIGVKREPVEGAPGIERLTTHVELAPWQPEKYGKWSQQLGPPTRVALKFAPDDIVAAQAHVASETLGPPTHLFAAIKDTTPPNPESFDGIIKGFFALRSLPGYVGAWPQPGALDRLPLGLGRGQPVAPGMNRLIGGVYRYTGGGFSIVSFQPEVLNASLPFIAADEVADSAQVRVHVGNLRGSQLENWVNAQLYSRADETSGAGARFLNLLSRQLKVPPEQAKNAATDILSAELQCSLGGEYVYSDERGGWTSTAYRGDLLPGQAPTDYVAPLMSWFRGLDATLTQYPDRLVADAVIDVARSTPSTTNP